MSPAEHPGDQPEAAEQSADELSDAPVAERRVDPDDRIDPDDPEVPTAPAEAEPDWDPARATEPTAG